ncbi:MAG: hypothetical protein ACLQAT_09210 [Candidatus Binataceae bacterium]
MSNSISGFQVQDLPPPPAPPPGTVLLGIYQGTLLEAQQAQTAISGTALDTPDIKSSLSNIITNLSQTVAQIQDLQQGIASSVDFGAVNGVEVLLTSADLPEADRTLAGLISALANSPASADRGSRLPDLLFPEAFAQTGTCAGPSNFTALGQAVTQPQTTAPEIAGQWEVANSASTVMDCSFGKGRGGPLEPLLAAGDLALTFVEVEPGVLKLMMVIYDVTQNLKGVLALSAVNDDLSAGKTPPCSDVQDALGLTGLLPGATGKVAAAFVAGMGVGNAVVQSAPCGKAPPTCAAPQSECDGMCTNFSTDLDNCGACNPPPEDLCNFGCSGGHCTAPQMLTCPPTGNPNATTACLTGCSDTTSDPINCGGCTVVGDNHSCGPEACVNGQCAVGPFTENFSGTLSGPACPTVSGGCTWTLTAQDVTFVFTPNSSTGGYNISSSGTGSVSSQNANCLPGSFSMACTGTAKGGTASISCSAANLQGSGPFSETAGFSGSWTFPDNGCASGSGNFSPIVFGQ